MMKTFACLKRRPKRVIMTDFTELTRTNLMEATKLNFRNQHCDFKEELDEKFPEPFMKEVGTSVFVDSNYGYGKVTGE